MSTSFQAVGWNRQKRIYDLTLGGVLLVGMAAYGGTLALVHPATTAETFLIRFSALAALILLHVILAIGPLCRLDARFLPFLYNRRHLGVTMFFLALFHAGFSVFQFHALGDQPALWSALTAYAADYGAFFSGWGQWARFPFEILGAGALLCFFVMAATSHDFWLKNLGPSLWKTLHLLVYPAYGLVLSHVLLGALQSERHVFPAMALGMGFVCLVGLHLLAFVREQQRDRAKRGAEADGFVSVLPAGQLQEGRGQVVLVGDERLAVFLHEGRVHALSNVCRHQGGPLGEGRIVYGCLTCPWHGYQYRVEDGCSPPPFTEQVPTYQVRLVEGMVWVHPEPLPLGTRSEGVDDAGVVSSSSGPFYIGWETKGPAGLVGHVRLVVALLVVAVAGVMAGLALTQQPVDTGRFAFGQELPYEGILVELPVPLLVSDTGQSHLLVGPGKFGPPPAWRGHHGQRIRFTGTLIERAGQKMLETTRPDSLKVLDAHPVWRSVPLELGEATLTGELVDTKCFFGVMRPATGKIHKGCAVRCLSGGVPPGLLVREPSGDGMVVLLAGPGGEALKYDVAWAADVVEARGRLEIREGFPLLKVDHLERRVPVVSKTD